MTPEFIKALCGTHVGLEPCRDPDCREPGCVAARDRDDDEYHADHDPDWGNRSEA